MSLLFDPSYVNFLRETHPELHISQTRLGAPYFFSPISCFEPLLPGLIRHLARLGGKFLPSLARPKALVFGLPFEPYEQSAVLDILPEMSLMTAMAQDSRAEIILITNVDKRPAVEKLLERGFFLIPSFPDMRLELGMKNFAEYLSSLPAKYRTGMRKNIRRFHEKKHRLVETPDISPGLASHFYSAYCHARSAAKIPWIPYQKDYFSALHQRIPQSHVSVAIDEGGNFLGMVQAIQEGDLFHIARLATTEAAHRQDGIFFRLLYASIERAITQGSGQILLGPTSYTLKRRLGAKAFPLNNLLLPISPQWRALVSVVRPASFNYLLRHLGSLERLEKLY